MSDDRRASPVDAAARPVPRWHVAACIGLLLFAAHVFVALDALLSSLAQSHPFPGLEVMLLTIAPLVHFDAPLLAACLLYPTCAAWPLFALALRLPARGAERYLFIALCLVLALSVPLLPVALLFAW